MKRQILLGGMLAALMAAPILGSLLAQAATTGAPADAAPVPTSVDLSKFDCRTLLHMEGEDRDQAMIFLHGYVSAQKRQTTIDFAPLADATDKIVDFCIDHRPRSH
jgi:HdeA/HdeB family protein